MSDDSQTFAKYAALLDAYRSGMTSVSYEGQSISYMSRADMRKVLDEMEADLGISTPRRGVLSRMRPGIYNKGL